MKERKNIYYNIIIGADNDVESNQGSNMSDYELLLNKKIAYLVYESLSNPRVPHNRHYYALLKALEEADIIFVKDLLYYSKSNITQFDEIGKKAVIYLSCILEQYSIVWKGFMSVGYFPSDIFIDFIQQITIRYQTKT